MKNAAAVLFVLVTSFYFWNSAKPDGLLHVFFLDVGQGDSIFIRTPSGKNILVDGGPQKNVLVELKDVLPLWDRRLDFVVPTHPDRDHLEGLISVLQRYPVDKVYFSGIYKNDWLSRDFFKAVKENAVALAPAYKDSDVALDDGVAIDFLFPFKYAVGPPYEVTNNLSVVAKIIFGENTVLLTGDVESPVEEALMAYGANIQADVLKIAHHGSKTSTTDDFLRTVSPEYSVISVGVGNSYHHPSPSIIQKLKDFCQTILRTDENGRIEMVFSKEELIAINTKKAPPKKKSPACQKQFSKPNDARAKLS